MGVDTRPESDDVPTPDSLSALTTRAALVLGLLLVLMASCSESDVVPLTTPVATLATTAAPTTAVPEAPPTGAVDPVTTTAPSTTTTEITVPTAAVPMLDVVDRVPDGVEVIPGGPVFPVAATTCLVGGVSADAQFLSFAGFQDWDVDAGDLVQLSPAPPFTGGETYRVVGPDGEVATSRGDEPAFVCDPVPDSLYVEFEPSLTEDFWQVSPLAIGGTWELFPQPVDRLATDQPVYLDATVALLASLGLDDAEPMIRHISRVDLEGDGVDEVVIEASNIDAQEHGGAPYLDAGEYSVVFVRKLVEGEVLTAVLGASVGVGDEAFSLLHRLSAVADVNGDGDMEITTEAGYYEGMGHMVWDFTGTRFEVVLACGCGA